MTYVNGDVYEGDWVENAREGHGTYWKHEYGRHRAEYVGEWRRGKREGFGVFHDELGQRFEGDWVRSKRHGRGRQTAIANAEDREYQTDGSYDGGNPPGVDLYEGDWVEDRMTGEGVMSYANGDVFAGGWLDGEKHGSGTHLYAGKGRAYEGVWDRGTPRCGTYREALPNEAERILGMEGTRGVPRGSEARDAKTKMKPLPDLGLVEPREVETESRDARLRDCGAR